MNLTLDALRAIPSFCAHRKILIVDDQEQNRNMNEYYTLKEKPAEDTFEIQKASTVEEGKEAIKNYRPDILLTDGHIDSNNYENPDGIRLANFAKYEQGIKSIGLISGSSDTVSKAKDAGYEAINKSNIFNPEFKEFFGNLLDKLTP